MLVLLAILLILYRNWRYEQELDSLLWKVNYKDIQLKESKDVTANNDQIVKTNSKVNFRKILNDTKFVTLQ